MRVESDACRSTLEQVGAYLDGELDAPACRLLEAHAAGCTRCAGEIETLRLTVGMCRDAGHASLPPDVRTRARDAVRRLLSARSLGE